MTGRGDLGSGLRARLQERLRDAMAASDAAAVAALRATIAAIGNAEAVVRSAEEPGGTAIEVSPKGVGATDVPRREVPDGEVLELIRREISERQEAAATYAAHGHATPADRLLAEARVLEQLLADL